MNSKNVRDRYTRVLVDYMNEVIRNKDLLHRTSYNRIRTEVLEEVCKRMEHAILNQEGKKDLK